MKRLTGFLAICASPNEASAWVNSLSIGGWNYQSGQQFPLGRYHNGRPGPETYYGGGQPCIRVALRAAAIIITAMPRHTGHTRRRRNSTRGRRTPYRATYQRPAVNSWRCAVTISIKGPHQRTRPFPLCTYHRKRRQALCQFRAFPPQLRRRGTNRRAC